MRTNFHFAICLAAILPTGAMAENHLFPGTEIQPPTAAPGFVILKQPQADHVVTLFSRPVSGQGGDPEDHVWERTQPAGNGYAAERTIRWNATASCAEGIDWIRITGPGGTQTQTFNGSRNAIAGFVGYDSFEPDALDAVCLGWGQSTNTACANGETTGCESEAVFDENHRMIVRGSAPVTVSGACTDGLMTTRTYHPRLELICRREQ